jgi:hypothetical protein
MMNDEWAKSRGGDYGHGTAAHARVDFAAE